MNSNQGLPVAQDDDGQPLTEQDLMPQSYQSRPFEVALAGAPASVVLADQVTRKATRKGRVSAAELAEVRAKLVALIG